MFTTFTTLHFTPIGLALCIAAPLLLAFLIWLVGRSVPPVERVPGAGVGGLLLVLLLVLAIKAGCSLFELVKQGEDVVRVISVDSSFAWPAIKATLPAFINTCAVVSALILLTMGRSRGAMMAALVAIWVMGPGDDLLKMLILGVPFSLTKGFAGISFFTILSTLYLLFSVRSARTYGLGKHWHRYE